MAGEQDEEAPLRARPRVVAIIPALNEAPAIGEMVGGLRALGDDAPDRVIVVDNGSTDGTGERARAAGATVVRQDRRGRRRGEVRRLRRSVLCLDADPAGQSSGAEMGRQAQTPGCAVVHLTADHLVGAKDVAGYWQAHGTPPTIPRELVAEEETALDADLVLEYAARYSPDDIAARIADRWARREDGERAPALRRTIADRQAIAARRAIIDAERARTPRDADTGPDDGDTGEAWVEEG